MKIKLIALAPLLFAACLLLPMIASADSGVDLSIESISFEPDQPLLNQLSYIVVQIKYTGDRSLTSPVGVTNVAFSHEDFEQIVSSSAGVSVAPSISAPFYSDTTYTYTFVGKFTSVGSKKLVFKVDGSNELVESDESNNTASITVDILKGNDLIKRAGDSAVYIVKDDGQKHLFVNGPTFWSYYTGDWSNLKLDGERVYIQELSQADFDAIPIGENMTIKSGKRLIKFQNSSKIYAIFGDSKLMQIGAQTAASLYGADWKSKVITIQNGFEADYTRDDISFVDSDGDGLSDEDETNIYDTDAYKADSDGDGYNDGLEVFSNYDPTTK